MFIYNEFFYELYSNVANDDKDKHQLSKAMQNVTSSTTFLQNTSQLSNNHATDYPLQYFIPGIPIIPNQLNWLFQSNRFHSYADLF